MLLTSLKNLFTATVNYPPCCSTDAPEGISFLRLLPMWPPCWRIQPRAFSAFWIFLSVLNWPGAQTAQMAAGSQPMMLQA